MKLFIKSLLAVLLLSSVCHCGEAEFPGWQPYDKLTGALVTPHIPFANPCSGGKLKTLVIAPTWTQRETVELAERLSLDYTPLMTESYEFFGSYPGAGERSSYLTISKQEFEKLVNSRLGNDRVYDLIIIGKIPWKVFPEDVQKIILNKVQNGAGLLYINPSDLPADMQNALKVDESVKNAKPPECLSIRYPF